MSINATTSISPNTCALALGDTSAPEQILGSCAKELSADTSASTELTAATVSKNQIISQLLKLVESIVQRVLDFAFRLINRLAGFRADGSALPKDSADGGSNTESLSADLLSSTGTCAGQTGQSLLTSLSSTAGGVFSGLLSKML